MANTLWEGYKEYKAKNENLTPNTLVEGVEEIRELGRLAKEGELITYAEKVSTSSKGDGTYQLKDGRVVEFHLSFGWMRRAFVWANRKDYDEYREAMPYNVYCEH